LVGDMLEVHALLAEDGADILHGSEGVRMEGMSTQAHGTLASRCSLRGTRVRSDGALCEAGVR
jgi:hypothetical protein